MACSPLTFFLCLHFPSPLSRFQVLSTWNPGSFHIDLTDDPTANELLIFSLELIPCLFPNFHGTWICCVLKEQHYHQNWEKFISNLTVSFCRWKHSKIWAAGVGRWLSWFLLRRFSSCLAALWSCRVCALSPFWITLWFVFAAPCWKDYLEVFVFFKQLTFYSLQSDSEYLHS